MITEKMIDLFNTNNLAEFQKIIIRGYFKRVNEDEEKHSADRLLIEQIADEKKVSEIIISTDELKIYTVSGKDEWDIKYPYRSIFLDDKKGKWIDCNEVSPNLDGAYLVYLAHKHLGANSEFVAFACKMLEMELED